MSGEQDQKSQADQPVPAVSPQGVEESPREAAPPDHSPSPTTRRIELYGAVVNTLTLIALTVYTCFVHDQLVEMRAANKSSEASTRETLESTEKALKIGQRPWIVDGSTHGMTVTLGKDRSVRFYIKNAGRSPALDVRPFGCSVLGGVLTDDFKIASQAECAPRPVFAIIGPGEDHWISIDLPFEDSELRQIQSGKRKLWILSGATYSDQFGESHHSEFCALGSPESGAWSTCETRKSKAN